MLDLDPGKYAAYVWPAYGVTVVAFVGMIVASLSHARRWRRRAAELTETVDAARRDAGDGEPR